MLPPLFVVALLVQVQAASRFVYGPKRSKGTTYRPLRETLEKIFEAQASRSEGKVIQLGGYSCRSGPFPTIISQWRIPLCELLSLAPSGLVSWQRAKDAFMELFKKMPCADPHQRAPSYTMQLSSEECATALRRCMYGLRREVLYSQKRQLGPEYDDILALIVDTTDDKACMDG